jgi:2-polyprenyl-3-methyl-5-hydroxy-6-metoxy-1,4-benzoquinol methylase
MHPPPPCLACGASAFHFVEAVPVRGLARSWATFRKLHTSPGVGDPAPQHVPAPGEVNGWDEAIRQAVGAEEVRFDRCLKCGLEVATPARCWPDGAYPEDEHYPVRWEFGRLLDDLRGVPRRVLELGCGAGQFLERAAARGHAPLGIDFNPAAVRKAKDRNLDVVRGGFEHLRSHLAGQRQDRTFDAVAMFHVIEHLPEPGELLRRLEEFVRPGTLLGLSCPGPNRFTCLIPDQHAGLRDWWDYPPHHVLRWSVPALRAFLEANGWEVIATEEEPFSFIDAAAQIGYTRALWRGYARRRWRTRLSILASRLRLLIPGRSYSGLSLYVLARFRG